MSAATLRPFRPLLLFTALVSSPLAWADDEPVTEKVARGEINWTDKTIMGTGSGAPDLKLPNVAAIRLAAERTAKLAAYDAVVEALRGLRITSTRLAAHKLAEPQIKAQVEGLVRGCKTADTRYFSDYGVDVVLSCSIDGIAMVLAPPDGHQPFQTAGERKYTGLVVDAVGLKLKPALSPRIIEPSSKPFYVQEMVKPAFIRKHGCAAFHRTVEGAKKDVRVGDNPMVVRAVSLGTEDSDVRLSPEELERLKVENLWFLLEGRVAIATDGP